MTMLLDRDMGSIMVEKKDEKDVPILKEDQDRINRFARLSNKMQSLQSEVKDKEREAENVKDALAQVEELTLLDEGDEELKFRLSIGETFVEVSADVATERLEAMTTQSDADLVDIKKDIEAAQKEMDELKVVLYAKFGKTINLELDPED